MIGWADGALIGPDESVFAANDRGALLGDGLFETVKTRADRVVFLDDHLKRLRTSARALDLAIDEAELARGMEAVLRGARRQEQGALRLTVTRGAGGRGLAPIPRQAQRPRTLVTWTAVPKPSAAPVRLALSDVRRNPFAPSCRHKTLSYADAAYARAQAARAGADDAVMLSTTGRAACTSIGNLWMLTDEGFVTPPLDEGVLPGIVRARLLCAREADGIPIRIGRIEAAALRRWPLFRSNSLMGVERAVVPDGAPASPDNALGLLYDRLEEAALS